MESAVEIILEPGDVLYREGDAPDCAYVIDTGEVKLFNQQTGERQPCERRGPGCVVGELSILTNCPRTMTVAAAMPTRLYRIDAADIIHRFNQIDPVLRACIETVIDYAIRHVVQTGTSVRPALTSATTLRDATELVAGYQLQIDITQGLKRGEFSMLYQPIVRLSDGAIVGLESLMRWQHPTRGPISPDIFITLAEKSGIIGGLSRYALSESCATLQRLRTHPAAAPELFMAVNISGQDIDRDGFVDDLAEIVDEHRLDPGWLKLELTETALVPDSDCALRNLEELRALGFGVAVDDFGTGYSNLAYLKALPLTALKIDRAFAGDACGNAVSRSIARMLIGLGHELSVVVVAEGLETPADVAMLRDLGCQLGQGYIFSEPVPEDRLAALLSAAPKQHSHAA